MLCLHFLQGVAPPPAIVVMHTLPIHTVLSVRILALGGVSFNDPNLLIPLIDQKEQHNTANTAMSAATSSSASTTNLFQPKFSNTNNYNYNSYMTYSNPVVITGSTGTTTIINSPP